jgi:hypothetical protein
MKPPIIVHEHGDTSIYASKEDAAKDLEAIDVMNGEYLAYDSEGLQLKLEASSRWGTVSIADPIPPVRQPEALRPILREYLHLFGVSDSWIDTVSLDDLVARSLDLYQ